MNDTIGDGIPKRNWTVPMHIALWRWFIWSIDDIISDDIPKANETKIMHIALWRLSTWSNDETVMTSQTQMRLKSSTKLYEDCPSEATMI